MDQDKQDTRDLILETVETSLAAQLRAVRRLRREKPARVMPTKKRTSNISLVENVLKTAGTPLHITEIIQRVRAIHGIVLDRESIVSALTKKVLKGKQFERTGKNTFSLLQEEAK